MRGQPLGPYDDAMLNWIWSFYQTYLANLGNPRWAVEQLRHLARLMPQLEDYIRELGDKLYVLPVEIVEWLRLLFSPGAWF